MPKQKWKRLNHKQLHKRKVKRNYDRRLGENMDFDKFLGVGK